MSNWRIPLIELDTSALHNNWYRCQYTSSLRGSVIFLWAEESFAFLLELLRPVSSEYPWKNLMNKKTKDSDFAFMSPYTFLYSRFKSKKEKTFCIPSRQRYLCYPYQFNILIPARNDPAQMASNTENVSIWGRHHVDRIIGPVQFSTTERF